MRGPFFMLVLEEDNKELYSKLQERNLVRQYDLLLNCIEIGLVQGHTAVDKYVLWALNHAAVSNISQFAGRFRKEPIYVGNHIPPHFSEVGELMDRFLSTIHENWFTWSPTQVSAYALWRLNWIHPFVEGNGRTARATSYLLMCLRAGGILPGKKIVPERIRENRDPYYAALRAADKAWNEGNLDFSVLDNYLAGLLRDQLSEI